jgi:hypothetical protein
VVRDKQFGMELAFGGLVGKLNDIVGYDKSQPSSPSISPDALFNDCGRKDLVLGHFYVFIPKESLQAKVCNAIKSFTKKNSLGFVVVEKEFCEGEPECHGHNADPIKYQSNKKYIQINNFPKDISGAMFYFFTKENFEKYKSLVDLTV